MMSIFGRSVSRMSSSGWPDSFTTLAAAAAAVAEPIACDISIELTWLTSTPMNPAATRRATERLPIRIAFGPMFGRAPSCPSTQGWRTSVARIPVQSTDAPMRQPVSPTSGT
jgi:hypothetical protein